MIDKIKSDSMDLLFEAILTLESVDDCYKFFDDLCTSIELKSFAQRLHVAKLLDEHRVYNSIVTETGASTATISRVNRSLKDGNDGYKLVFDINYFKKNIASIIVLIILIIDILFVICYFLKGMLLEIAMNFSQ